MNEIIIKLAESYPIISSIVAFMGITRMVLKPLMSFLHEFVIVTPSKKDNEILQKVESSKVFQVLMYLLDYFASVKIVKK